MAKLRQLQREAYKYDVDISGHLRACVEASERDISRMRGNLAESKKTMYPDRRFPVTADAPETSRPPDPE